MSVAGQAPDPLAGFAEDFVVADPSLIYLDGNSLGRLPEAAIDAVERLLHDEWGDELVLAWEHWIDLPALIGDRLAGLVGAEPGEVLISDQTSLNLFKLASAAVTPHRPDIVTDAGNFPSDVYVLEEVARAAGGALRVVDADPIDGVAAGDVAAILDERVGLVSHSHVGFRSGAIADMAAISEAAHQAGALVLWDLSHSVGAVPISLGADGADLAVGCTYKYLNGGPGAPAFLYVRRDLQTTLHQPVRGWWSHADMFGFSLDYEAAPDIRRFAVGTAPMLSLAAVGAAVDVTIRAGIDAIRSKSLALTEQIIELADTHLAGHGVTVMSPRDGARRGSHVALSHPEAYRLSLALRARNVIVDFRAPDTIRLGVAPLYLDRNHISDAIDHLREILETGEYEDQAELRFGVT